MNVLDFIKSEIAKWGDDYVYDLMENQYVPVLTNKGWKWVHASSVVLATSTTLTTLVR